MASLTPITVDGVLLESVAWGVEKKTREVAGVRPADMPISGVDGEAPSVNDDFEATYLTLEMYVRGTDADGYVPSGSHSVRECRKNLDMLSHLFSKRHALLDVREDTLGDGQWRQSWCKVIRPQTPDIYPGAHAKYKVELKVPEAFSQDLTVQDWTCPTPIVPGEVYEITTLRGSTAPVADAVILVKGPGTNLQVNDFASSAYVRLNAALTASQLWRINSGTWNTRYGTGLVLGSSDAAGTAADNLTPFGGGNARMLRLLPAVFEGERRVRVTLTGTGITSATALTVRARRKFLL